MSEQQVMFYLLLLEAGAMWEMSRIGRTAQHLYDNCGEMHELSCRDAFLLNSIGFLEF